MKADGLIIAFASLHCTPALCGLGGGADYFLLPLNLIGIQALGYRTNTAGRLVRRCQGHFIPLRRIARLALPGFYARGGTFLPLSTVMIGNRRCLPLRVPL